jgi:hypothetical protein
MFNNAFELFVKLTYQFLFYNQARFILQMKSESRCDLLTLILIQRNVFDFPVSLSESERKKNWVGGVLGFLNNLPAVDRSKHLLSNQSQVDKRAHVEDTLFRGCREAERKPLYHL